MDENLSGRGSAILESTVESYIVTGEPVSSATVAADLIEQVSSATVRNVMAELERGGYLSQPHTSAGRVPTERGYRLYVDRLLREDRITQPDERPIRKRLLRESLEFSEFLRRICRLLADLSDNVGVVLAPSLTDAVLQHIDFVQLDGRRVLVVFVARSGMVHSQVVTAEETMRQRSLDRASDYLVRRFAGRTLREVREEVVHLARRLEQPADRWQRIAHYLAARSFSGGLEHGELLVEGISRLLGNPDLGDRSELQALLEAVEERTDLVPLLSESPADRGPRILIGGERLPEALGQCTLVTAGYGLGGRALGALGILGPTRMEYARVIGVVDAMARAASKMLSELEAR